MQKDTMVTTLPRPPDSYWLLVNNETGRMEVLTMDLDGRGEALAVFGFEEEAGMFALWALGEGWRLRETTAGELVEMLSGPCAGVDFVTLDPLPELVSRGMAGLVSLRREHFVDRLVERAGLETAEPLAL